MGNVVVQIKNGRKTIIWLCLREREGERVGEILRGWSLAREQKRKGWLLEPHWCMKIIGVSRAYNFWLERKKNKS